MQRKKIKCSFQLASNLISNMKEGLSRFTRWQKLSLKTQVYMCIIYDDKFDKILLNRGGTMKSFSSSFFRVLSSARSKSRVSDLML